MKDRRKAVEITDNSFFISEMLCKKHPYSTSVGICAHCLKDKLLKLVCSDCGEQRLSSCSCSDISSSYRNSCSTMEVGSVGRISCLLENEKIESQLKGKDERSSEPVVFLRRSSSSCVDEAKRISKFWSVKRLFRKEKNKGFGKNDDFRSDCKSEIWVSDLVGVSRSRSLCSFRGCNDLDESVSRKSGLVGLFDDEVGLDSKGAAKRGVFPVKESEFSAMDESSFIDLKLDSSLEFKHEISSGNVIEVSSNHGLESEPFGIGGSLKSKGLFGNVGSCRNRVNRMGLIRGGKRHKVWKWILKHYPSSKKGGMIS